MLTKLFLFIALLIINNQIYEWLIQIDSILLREVTSSIIIALILQPFIIEQFN